MTKFSPNWRRVRLFLVRPPRYLHSYALNEAIEFLFHSLRRRGCEVDRGESEIIADGLNIIFCAHLLSRDSVIALPDNCIIYNTEQLGSGSAFDSPGYRTLLERFPVWDYSVRNVEQLRTILPAGHIYHVPIGYVPELTRIPLSPNEDIDVLFYGSLNERRELVLKGLRAAGLHVHNVFGVYGIERDRLISRSKVILNVHFYPTNIFEIIRVSYLLANGKAVVSECSPDTDVIPDLRDAVAFASYDYLVETCCSLVNNFPRRRALAQHAFESFSKLTFQRELAAAMAAMS